MPPPSNAVGDYLRACAAIIATGAGTDERSFYPALNNLLTAIGASSDPRRTTVPEPAARDGDYPDIAIFEESALVLVLPVEAKPFGISLDALAASTQPLRYARSFGAGRVLLTNLWEFAWAEVVPGREALRIIDRVRLVASADEMRRRVPRQEEEAGRRLAEMLNAACTLRANISDGDTVARLLAYHASRMRDSVDAAGDPHALLQPLAESMRNGLGVELESEFFGTTIVQTLVYAAFASWLDSEDLDEWDWRDSGVVLRARVVGELFHEITQPSFVRRCNLTRHLELVSRVLRWVDRDKFAAQFDNAAIEYFYEPFLARFDPNLRDRLGVWYTPKEVAAYQVRRADHHLIHDLDLPEGLGADEALILDPACGTGTYLRSVLDAIYRKHLANGEPETVAAARTREAALTRVVGFELLPAAFVVAHLNIHRYLGHIGAALEPDQRLRIYLTNALLGWSAGADPPRLPMPEFEEEIRESLRVKRSEPVLVMIGNPPYHGFSAADSDEEQALLNDWIAPLWIEYGLRKHRLGDLYVRFWRVAVQKIADLTGRGIVSFITNRKWLGGRSFPAMRKEMLHAFDDVIVDDLHGDVHDSTHPGDGSIFTTSVAAGIQRGVAITTLIRRGPRSGTPAILQGRDLRGSGAHKRALLAEFAGDRIDDGLATRTTSQSSRWKLIPFVTGDGPGLDEYFTFFRSGVQPVRDVVVDSSKERLRARMRAYFDPSIDYANLIAAYPGFGVVRARYVPQTVRQALLGDSAFNEHRLVPFLSHPFQVQWLYWETKHKLLNEPRAELAPYFLGPSGFVHGQLSIVAAQTARRVEAARPAITSAVPGFHVTDPDSRVMPRLAPLPSAAPGELALDFGDGAGGFKTNIRPEWILAARSAGAVGSDDEVGDSIFFALIAVMYAPSWAAAVGTDNDDFAPVPLPGDVHQLATACEIGRQIAALSDVQTPVNGVTSGSLRSAYRNMGAPDNTSLTRLSAGTKNAGGRWRPTDATSGTVMWDNECGWRNVPEAVWSFRVGGFPVLSKWLGYRHEDRGEPLTPDDIVAFTGLVRRIAAILDLGAGCEDAYEKALLQPLEVFRGE